MRAFRTKFALIGLAALGLLFAGCLLSATFVITHDFTFTSSLGFYFYAIDVTANPDWAEHRDKIDDIDAVGFEMTMINANAYEVSFSAYIAPWESVQQYTTKDQLDSNAFVIIEDLMVPVGTSTMTYVQSLGHLKNLTKLKELAKTGKFHYYGTAGGVTTNSFTVDPGRVVLTVSAGE